MQITRLQEIELKHEINKAEQQKKDAAEQLVIFRLTAKNHTGDDDYALDTGSIIDYAKASTRVEYLKNLQLTAEIANPKGNEVQIGSYVEVLSMEGGLMQFVVVEETFTVDPIRKEIKPDAPLVEAVFGGTVGEIFAYSVNGKDKQVAIGLVDNNYCDNLATQIETETTYSKTSA